MKLAATDILNLPHDRAVGFEKGKRIELTGVSTDTRSVNKGDLFIALRGCKFDGHDFLTKTVGSGARAVVVEKKWAEFNSILLSSLYIPALIVESTLHTLGDLGRMIRRRFDIPILVVAGSNGKTTTKDMIANVLGMKYRVLSTQGNLNNQIGVPQTLFRLEEDHQIAVIEIGTNHFGELAYLCTIVEPTHALITTIGREHLEFFGSIEGVAQAEGEVFEWCKSNGTTSGSVFVNADDPFLAEQVKSMRKKVTYGLTAEHPDVMGRILTVNNRGCVTLRVKPTGKRPIEIELSVPGQHNALNALAAVTVGLTFKVPRIKIQEALQSFTASSKRMQIVTMREITVINDTYNSNPDSVLAAFSTLNSISSSGRKIAVLADMLELGARAVEEHSKIGSAVEGAGIECLLTFGPLSKSTHDAATIEHKIHFNSKAMLSEHLAGLVAPGDVVLVKGSNSMKMEEVVLFLAEHAKAQAQTV
ncbi:MAG: UDP-N-acetylmuramoyl-tripeptide--D-alanyl-D-alanine ligase [bacterium]